jgi:hypothetical protein
VLVVTCVIVDGLIGITGTAGALQLQFNDALQSLAGLCTMNSSYSYIIGGNNLCCTTINAWSPSFVTTGGKGSTYRDTDNCFEGCVAPIGVYPCACSSISPELCDPSTYQCSAVYARDPRGYVCTPIPCPTLTVSPTGMMANVTVTNGGFYPSFSNYTCASGFTSAITTTACARAGHNTTSWPSEPGKYPFHALTFNNASISTSI